MRNKDLARLVAGFEQFRRENAHGEAGWHLPENKPKTLFIACSDSRVDPSLITHAHPGELFIVRNVGNLVPPFERTIGFHGVSSAIEFAVENLLVENIIVMGHRQCGGIRALMLNEAKEGGFVEQWMKIVKGAKQRVLKRFPQADEDSLCRHAELESIIDSLANLRTFPFVVQAVQERGLNLIGAYFDLENGEMLALNPETQEFEPI